MGDYRRNDIAVAVENDGSVWIAQGGPALSAMMENDIDDSEDDLFYSQIHHRCAWRDDDGLHVGTPTEARKAGAAFVRFARPLGGMCGSPVCIGKVA